MTVYKTTHNLVSAYLSNFMSFHHPTSLLAILANLTTPCVSLDSHVLLTLFLLPKCPSFLSLYTYCFQPFLYLPFPYYCPLTQSLPLSLTELTFISFVHPLHPPPHTFCNKSNLKNRLCLLTFQVRDKVLPP